MDIITAWLGTVAHAKLGHRKYRLYSALRRGNAIMDNLVHSSDASCIKMAVMQVGINAVYEHNTRLNIR